MTSQCLLIVSTADRSLYRDQLQKCTDVTWVTFTIGCNEHERDSDGWQQTGHWMLQFVLTSYRILLTYYWHLTESYWHLIESYWHLIESYWHLIEYYWHLIESIHLIEFYWHLIESYWHLIESFPIRFVPNQRASLACRNAACESTCLVTWEMTKAVATSFRLVHGERRFEEVPCYSAQGKWNSP